MQSTRRFQKFRLFIECSLQNVVQQFHNLCMFCILYENINNQHVSIGFSEHNHFREVNEFGLDYCRLIKNNARSVETSANRKYFEYYRK